VAGGTGGDWLAEQARRPRWQHVPAIPATSCPDSVFAQALRRVGVPVLAKPASTMALRSALDEVGVLLPPQGRLGLYLEAADLLAGR
jgi:hypothetical protein